LGTTLEQVPNEFDYEDGLGSTESVVAPRFRRDAIRRATDDDAAAIADLEVERGYGRTPAELEARRRQRYAHWQKVLRGEAAGPTAEVWIAEEDRELIGFAHCNVGDGKTPTAQVFELRVTYEHKGRGVPELLLKKCIRLAQKRGARLLSVVLSDVGLYGEDDAATAAHRLGFHPVFTGPVARADTVTEGAVVVKDVVDRSAVSQ
jgi:ribosomal protein S18 acetylase RimI-like enzyme